MRQHGVPYFSLNLQLVRLKDSSVRSLILPSNVWSFEFIFFLAILSFMILQTFSIGFWSGDIAGQGSSFTPFSAFHSFANFDWCFGSLSSCNTQSRFSSPK